MCLEVEVVQSGRMVQACDPSTKVEVGRSGVQSHSLLQSKFETSLGYVSHSSQKPKHTHKKKKRKKRVRQLLRCWAVGLDHQPWSWTSVGCSCLTYTNIYDYMWPLAFLSKHNKPFAVSFNCIGGWQTVKLSWRIFSALWLMAVALIEHINQCADQSTNLASVSTTSVICTV